jgi:hypothetical protein
MNNMTEHRLPDMNHLTAADALLFLVGLVFAKIGAVCAAIFAPVIAFLFPWDFGQIGHWIVAGCFSVIGICAGKVVEVYTKDYLRRRRRRNQANDR